MKKRAVTVTLPAPHKAQIKCPICKGNKCIVCNMTGNLKIDVAPKIPIQRAHIIKYVMENMQDVSQELTRMYGLVPEIGTKEVVVVFPCEPVIMIFFFKETTSAKTSALE